MFIFTKIKEAGLIHVRCGVCSLALILNKKVIDVIIHPLDIHTSPWMLPSLKILFFPPIHTLQEETTASEDYGWFDIMHIVSVNSPNKPLDQIGLYTTSQIGPDEANCDCPDECADHGRENGPGPCDACPSGTHVVPSEKKDGSHADTAICSLNYDVVAAIYPSAAASPSGPNRNYGVGLSGPSRVITTPNSSNSSSELEYSNKLFILQRIFPR
ncbi:hypothetical protein ACFX14_005659 [Malus domestica]